MIRDPGEVIHLLIERCKELEEENRELQQLLEALHVELPRKLQKTKSRPNPLD